MVVLQKYEQELQYLPFLKDISNLIQDLDLDPSKFTVMIELKDNYTGSHPVVLTLTRALEEKV